LYLIKMINRILLISFILLLFPFIANSAEITTAGFYVNLTQSYPSSYSYPTRIEYFDFNNFYLDYSNIGTRQVKYNVVHNANVNQNSTLIITKSRSVYSSKLCEDSPRFDGTNTCSFTYDDALIGQDYLYAYLCTPDLDYCKSKTFKFLLRNDSEKMESGFYVKFKNSKSSSYSYPARVEYFNFDNFYLNFSNITTRGVKYDVEHNMNVNQNSTLIITKSRSVYSSKLCQDSLRFDGTNTCSFAYDDALIGQDYLYAYLCTPDLDYCKSKTFKFLLRNDSEKIESGFYVKFKNSKSSTYSYPARVEYFNFDNFYLNFSNITTRGVKYDAEHNMNVNQNSTLIITKSRSVYSSKLCEDSPRFDGTNTCSFTYDDALIGQQYLYAYLCTPDLDYCRTKTFKFLQRDTSELMRSGFYTQLGINNTKVIVPVYVSPTPVNNSVHKYQDKFTIKIIGNDETFESCLININGTMYPMILNGEYCTYDLLISQEKSTQEFEFQAFYNSSGSQKSIEQRVFSVERYRRPRGGENLWFPSNNNRSIIFAVLTCMFYLLLA